VGVKWTILIFSLSDLQVQLLGARSYRLHATRSARDGCGNSAAIHALQSDEMGRMGELFPRIEADLKAARDELMRELGAHLPPLNPLATPPADTVAFSHQDLPPVFSNPPNPLSAPDPLFARKRGDALGQPRKTGTEHRVEIQSPTPEPEDRLARNRQEYERESSHEVSGSVRGTKRALARTPLKITTPTRLGVDIQSALERSPSAISVTSTNERPRKRINGSPLASPCLAPSHSTPPPTRCPSPHPVDEMDIDELLATTPPPSRLARMLRREASSPRLRSADPAATPNSKSLTPRSLLISASSKQTPLKEIHAVQVHGQEMYATSPSSRVPRALPALNEGKTLDAGKDKKETWNAPRLMSMLYSIGRSGTSEFVLT
jgi:hypothetical protein